MDADILSVALLLLCAFLAGGYAGFLALYIYVKSLTDCGNLVDDEDEDDESEAK